MAVTAQEPNRIKLPPYVVFYRIISSCSKYYKKESRNRTRSIWENDKRMESSFFIHTHYLSNI